MDFLALEDLMVQKDQKAVMDLLVNLVQWDNLVKRVKLECPVFPASKDDAD